MFSKIANPSGTALFGLKRFKKFPEVIPLVVIMGIATLGVSTFCGYALTTKTDVHIDRKNLARFQTIDVNQPQKLLTFKQQYGEDPEVTLLKKEIAEAYKGQ